MHDDSLEAYLRDALGPDTDLASCSGLASYKPPSSSPRGVPDSKPPEGPAFAPLEEIARGGMGVVFRARQASLDRDVAVKRLLPGSRRGATAKDFLAEALVQGQLEHPNITPVYELGQTPGGEPFLAMKLLSGQSWASLLQAEPRALGRHLDILRQVCNAVAFAHSRGVVHNDIKPANVMLGAFGEVLLIDWGLAVCLENGGDPRLRAPESIRSFCGTPGYAPPELARGDGQRIGPWTDVYLLGGLLYTIVSGHPPHEGERFIDVVRAAREGQVAPLDDAVPGELRALCARALQAEPGARHRDVSSFLAELERYLQHRESLQVSERAQRTLHSAQQRALAPAAAGRPRVYEGFAEAVAGFAAARRLWADNEAAQQGEREARAAYARAALDLGDLALAAAQAAGLAEAGGAAEALLADVAARERAQRRERAARRRLRRGLAVTLLLGFLGLLSGLLLLDRQNRAIEGSNQSLRAEKAEVLRQKQALESAHVALRAAHGAVQLEKQRVEQQRTWAERRGQIAQGALQRLSGEVQNVLLRRLADDRAVVVADALLQVALDGWGALRDAAVTERDTSRGTALVRSQVGLLQLDVAGDARGALRELQAATQIYAGLLAAQPDDPVAQADLGEACFFLARVHTRQGNLAGAEQELERASGLLEPLAQRRQLQPAAARNLRNCVALRASLAVQRGDLAKARGLHARHLELCRAQAAMSGAPEDAHAYALALFQLGELQQQAGQLSEAERLCAEALAAMSELDAGQPDVQSSLALVHLSRVLVEQRRGNTGRAAEHLGISLELLRAQYARHPESAAALSELARGLQRAASLAKQRGQLDPAAALMAEQLQLLREVCARDASNATAQGDLIRGLERLASLSIDQGARERAGQQLDEALRLVQRRIAADSNWLDIAARARLYNVQATLRATGGVLAAASPLFQQALVVQRRLLAAEPENIHRRLELAATLSNLGRFYWEQGQTARARACYEENLELCRRLVALDSANFELSSQLAHALGNAADLRLRQGEDPSAAALRIESLQLLRGWTERDPDNGEAREQLAAALGKLGESLLTHEPEQALHLFDESVALQRSLVGLDSTNVRAGLGLYFALQRRGTALAVLEEGAASLRAFEQGLEACARAARADPQHVEAQRQLIMAQLQVGRLCMEEAGQPLRAEALLDQALQAARRLVLEIPSAASQGVLWKALSARAELEMRKQRPRRALPLFRQGLEQTRALRARDASDQNSVDGHGYLLERLGEACIQAGALEEGLSCYDELLALRGEQAGQDADLRQEQVYGLHQRALLYEGAADYAGALDELQQAQQLQRELLELSPEREDLVGSLQYLVAKTLEVIALAELDAELRAPADALEAAQLGQMRQLQGRHAAAVAAFEQAFADPSVRSPGFLRQAALAAAQASRAEPPEQAARLHRLALSWLAALLDGARQQSLALRAGSSEWDAISRENVELGVAEVLADPGLDPLREHPGFAELTAE